MALWKQKEAVFSPHLKAKQNENDLAYLGFNTFTILFFKDKNVIGKDRKSCFNVRIKSNRANQMRRLLAQPPSAGAQKPIPERFLA